MSKAYSVYGVTKKGGEAGWRYDALCSSAAEAKEEALDWWEKERPASAAGCHLFRVKATLLPKEEFPVCLGRWFKTGEWTKGGYWLNYELPKVEGE